MYEQCRGRGRMTAACMGGSTGWCKWVREESDGELGACRWAALAGGVLER